MDLRRLAHIVAVADQRSFARAAEQVNLSQPALTRSVQAAEREFGFQLFDRGATAVTATPAGQFIVDRARRLVDDGRSLKRDVERYRERELGDTAFGVGPYPLATFVPEVVAEMRREFPGVNLRVEVSNAEELLRLLLEEDIEFFVVDTRSVPPDARLVVETLRQEPAGFYVRQGHPLAKRRTVTLAEIWRHGVASVRVSGRIATTMAALLDLPPSAEIPLALRCDDVALLKNAALSSDIVLIAPGAAFAAEIEDGALRELKVKGLSPLYAALGVITLRGRSLSPMAQEVIGRLPAAPAQTPVQAPVH